MLGVGILAVAASAWAVDSQRLAAQGYAVHADGRVAVMVELSDPPAVEVYQSRMTASALAAGVSAGATAVVQAHIARLQQAQQVVVDALAGPQFAASVLYRAQRVYNGVAAVVDADKLEALRALPGVKGVHPLIPKHTTNSTSVPFIGAPQVWAGAGHTATGTGVKVGLIDTGIDYLHADFGGSGNYRTDGIYVAPNWPRTAKVVGGWDFVGDNYDPLSLDASANTPQPDPDPMDCATNGHGTHVAGTLAGYGVTAAGTTYAGPWNTSTPFGTLKIGPGVAPGAQLYALRIFGCQGSTEMVVPAIEWALDPNQDGNFADHLDVISMSLGASFGSPDDPDEVASNNAASAGVIVVAAAGNDGDGFFITGDPAAADRAISVAAAGDPGASDYFFHVASPSGFGSDIQATPAGFGPPLPAAGLAGDLVQTSPADACGPLTNGSAIGGKIALIDRGGTKPDGSTCTFVWKVAAAQAAGAAGVIVDNNRDSTVRVIMSDDGSKTTITVPSVFISQNDGQSLKADLPSPGVNGNIYRVSAADQIASFSSRGPRLPDFALKPDIAAPGLQIFSAAVGTGTGGFYADGTSMATPHVSGAMALLKQIHPTWTVEELKALVMNTADHDVFLNPGHTLPMVGPGRVGAGRVDVAAAATAPAVAYNADLPGAVSVSFGALEVVDAATLVASVKLVNKSSGNLTYSLGYQEVDAIPGVSVSFPGGSSVSVPSGGSTTFDVRLAAEAAQMKHTHDPSLAETSESQTRAWLSEEAGYVTLSGGSGPTLRVPLYAAVRPASSMTTVEQSFRMPAAPGSLTLHLAGQDVATGTSFPLDEVSLVSAFELQEANFDPAAAVRYFGVASDLQAQAALGKGLADATLYFGIAATTPWTSPIEEPFDIRISVNGDTADDFELFMQDFNIGDDVYVVTLCNLNTIECSSVQTVNGVTAGVRDTVPFNTDVVMLPVPVAALGLSPGNTELTYYLNNWAAPRVVHSFDLSHPGLSFPGTAYPGSASLPPLLTDIPGQTIQVAVSPVDYANDQALGVLLLHYHNVAGTHAEVLAPDPREPRRLLKRR